MNERKNMNMNIVMCCRHMMDMEEITLLDNVFPTTLVALKQRKALVMSTMKGRKQRKEISEFLRGFSTLNSLHHDSGRAAGEASSMLHGSFVM